MEDLVAGCCKVIPEPILSLLEIVGCSRSLHLGYLYALHEAQLQVRKLMQRYDKNNDKENLLKKLAEMWQVNILVWGTLMLAPLVFFQANLRDGKGLKEYTALLVSASDVFVTIFAALLELPRKTLIPLQLISHALKGAAASQAGKAPMASWIALFYATAKPMGLVHRQLADFIKGAPTIIVKQILATLMNRHKDTAKTEATPVNKHSRPRPNTPAGHSQQTPFSTFADAHRRGGSGATAAGDTQQTSATATSAHATATGHSPPAAPPPGGAAPPLSRDHPIPAAASFALFFAWIAIGAYLDNNVKGGAVHAVKTAVMSFTSRS